MQKRFDSVVNPATGTPLAGASVQVNIRGGGAATIYSDNGITARPNPITTDPNGYFEYYAADGRYDWVITGTGLTTVTVTDVLHEDSVDYSPENVSILRVGSFVDTPALVTGTISASGLATLAGGIALSGTLVMGGSSTWSYASGTVTITAPSAAVPLRLTNSSGAGLRLKQTSAPTDEKEWSLETTGGSNSPARFGAMDDANSSISIAWQVLRSAAIVLYTQFFKKVYPPNHDGTAQTSAALYAGAGVPSNANGANGDFYFRSDGGAGTCVYQKRAGAWVATGA